MADRIVGYLKSRGVDGHRVLEVGGGIGAAHIELLKAGAVNGFEAVFADRDFVWHGVVFERT